MGEVSPLAVAPCSFYRLYMERGLGSRAPESGWIANLTQTDKMYHLQQQRYPKNDEKEGGWSQPGVELEFLSSELSLHPDTGIIPVDISVARHLPMANTHVHMSSMSSSYLSLPYSLWINPHTKKNIFLSLPPLFFSLFLFPSSLPPSFMFGPI